MVDDLFDISGDDIVLRVHVQPAAGRTHVAGRHGNALKVRVAAPPGGGRANDAVAALIAELFGVAPSSVALAGGGTSRVKRFRVAGIEPDEARRRIEQAVDDGNAAPGPDVRRH